MIKQLITDLTYGTIDLNSGLIRAKLIAHKIKNDDLRNWIRNEINGYIDDAIELPSYRLIPCEIYAILSNPFHGDRSIPFDVSNIEKQAGVNLHEMQVRQSISTLLISINKSEDTYAAEMLPLKLVQILREATGEPQMSGVERRIQPSQLKHILEVTKNKLIDTLLDLDSAFPNLEDDFNTSKESHERVQTIINQNIYGDNSNSNIGIGENIEQSISNTMNTDIDELINELRALNVPNENLNELKEILIEDKDKVSIGKKVVNWISKISQITISKSIELKLPEIIEKIEKYI